MSIFHDNSLIGASGQSTGYLISRSVRLNSPDSAYFSRTPASAGNRKTWTWAGWVKRSKLSEETAILSARLDNNTRLFCGFDSTSNSLQIYANNGAINVVTAGSFRDLSAWYHIAFSFDTTQATSSNRVKIFVNGIQQTLSGTFPNQNTDFEVNNTVQHTLGSTGPALAMANLYLAESYLIDGQALDPTSFGEFSATTGVWMPKRYAGTYGTNGFKLDFSDNSAATATTLGKDSSGNGNNWTPNNLSVTAGAGNDSLVDVPTNGSEVDTGAGGQVRGNYCTLNPLAKVPFGSGTGPMANGNLELVGASSVQYVAVSNIALNTSVYAEFVGATQYLGLKGANSNDYYIWFGTNFDRNGSNEAVGVSYNSTDVVGIAFNPSTLVLTFYKNGASQYTKTIASGEYVFLVSTVNAGNCVCNFGQRPFAYTAPSGFKALCTANLPTPTITKGSSYFDVKLWTGNGSSQTISGLNFSPDFVWTKGRNAVTNHNQVDTVRGYDRYLFSNSTAAEGGNAGALTSFTSDGFTLGNDIYINGNGTTFVAWCWDAGSSTVTNTQGSISSQVRANASAGFSIVTGTAPASGNFTYGHGLGVIPSLVIFKDRANANGWVVHHSSVCTTSSQALFLNGTGALASYTNIFGTALPTSSVAGGLVGTICSASANFVAYCFAPVAGYSSFGSYTGNGSTDGPFVYTGFRSRFILIKCTSAASNWSIFDAARLGYNVTDRPLWPNLSNAESQETDRAIDILSNGFKPRPAIANVDVNQNAATYIYACFAESPFQYARAR